MRLDVQAKVGPNHRVASEQENNEKNMVHRVTREEVLNNLRLCPCSISHGFINVR